jgi:hypothetical protein
MPPGKKKSAYALEYRHRQDDLYWNNIVGRFALGGQARLSYLGAEHLLWDIQLAKFGHNNDLPKS